jgi:hypothetical protein
MLAILPSNLTFSNFRHFMSPHEARNGVFWENKKANWIGAQ